MYVIQHRKHDWVNQWVTLSKRFETLADAEKALAERSPKSLYRIAEEYTVIRYKAVKREK